MSPLPPAAQAARAAAEAATRRRNLGGALVIFSFVAGVFAYSISAVEQDQITERELAQFRAQRDRQNAHERNAQSPQR